MTYPEVVRLSIEQEGARVTAMRMVKSIWTNHGRFCNRVDCDVLRTIENLGDIIQNNLEDKIGFKGKQP